MKTVFVTGISGYIGGTVAIKLREAGHRVLGLVRKEEDETRLRAAGMIPVRGDLQAAEAIGGAIGQSDAVVHTADSDAPAVTEMFLSFLRGTGKAFIHTSGSAIVANWADRRAGEFVFTEDYPFESRSPFENRAAIHAAILRAAVDGVRSVVMVPGMVYGTGLFIAKESKQIPFLIRSARKMGKASYIGDGAHRWSHVHVEDLADLYLAALREAKPGSVFFAENGSSSFLEIARAIHRELGLAGAPASLTPAEAKAEWGELMATVALGSDCRISADKARLFLGWKPHRGPLENHLALS
ncbi:MAG: NAD-dependent epimerase/dehydratase family protein [Verrucomicrobium sp.]|nr:NAD-dependent epimerase/dehydratase family protein [Verrucomicrobium sp.]